MRLDAVLTTSSSATPGTLATRNSLISVFGGLVRPEDEGSLAAYSSGPGVDCLGPRADDGRIYGHGGEVETAAAPGEAHRKSSAPGTAQGRTPSPSRTTSCRPRCCPASRACGATRTRPRAWPLRERRSGGEPLGSWRRDAPKLPPKTIEHLFGERLGSQLWGGAPLIWASGRTTDPGFV